MSRINVLLTDGSSPAALHAIAALGRRHVIDVCDPRPVLCPARYSTLVRRTLACPCFGVSPISYAEFLVRRLKAERYDVLLPVNDQSYLVARFRNELGTLTRLPVPEFSAIQQLYDPDARARLLDRLGLAHVAQTPEACPNMAQAIFQNGRLLAFHASQARARIGGWVVARQSLQQDVVRDDLTRLGAHLDWHGAMSLHFALDPGTGRPIYGSASARLGETANAVAAGVNLPQWLVRVALADGPLTPLPPRRSSCRTARTHDLSSALRARAQDAGSWRAILGEIRQAVDETGIYRRSHDELLGAMGPLEIAKTATTLLRLFLQPRSSGSAAAKSYVLAEPTLHVIRQLSGKLL